MLASADVQSGVARHAVGLGRYANELQKVRLCKPIRQNTTTQRTASHAKLQHKFEKAQTQADISVNVANIGVQQPNVTKGCASLPGRAKH